MGKWILIPVLFLGVFGIVNFIQPKPFYVKAVSDTGELELTDGQNLTLSGVTIAPKGEDKHEAAIFLLREITRETQVWFEPEDDGYRVWVGCRRILTRMDCNRGILVNEAIVKAGVADVR